MVEMTPLDASVEANARRIHAVRMLAYRQEASLLGVASLPPLEQTVEDIRRSSERFVGAIERDKLLGVMSVCPEPESGSTCIASLVVHPQCQRAGIGRALLRWAQETYRHAPLTVQTAVLNTPALALYRSAGFVECRRWHVGAEKLELVALAMPRGSDEGAA